MCGIAGFWNISRQVSADKLHHIAQLMSDTILHRGPDSGGVWIDAETGIALGHRRLAIVDLSPEGHQPMMSANNRYVIVFNGEIYNFLELRNQLERLGHQFRGNSDTEVMLASFSQWGVDEAIQHFNGMFACVLWDRQEQILHLMRDRLGEKPLYYGWIGQTFLFSSELKALKAHPDFHAEINRDALALFLQYNYIPSPYSIYQGIYKLPPATILSWNGIDTRPNPVPYWSVKKAAELGVAAPFIGSEQDATVKLDTLLQDAVKIRTIADVPLGAFLSGGIDSSTIVALMQAQSSQAVRTFTIGFGEDTYNEAHYAKQVAKHLGTDHTEMYVTPEEALMVIPKLPILYDEPFSDSSQIPTFLVSQLARQHVTVSLTGDGGDELFAGYTNYWKGCRLWEMIRWIPPKLRQTATYSLKSLSPQTWNRALANLNFLLPAKLKQPTPGDKLHWIADILAVPDSEAFYTQMVSHCQEPEALVIGSSKSATSLRDRQQWANLSNFTQRVMYMDTVTYLPDDILVKVDRASMGVSLETRIPLLDHRIVEFAWQIPQSMKIRNGQGKWLLRQVLYNYVPQHLIERPKMGFSVPIDTWLRTSLRDWAEDLLDKHRLQQEGYLNPQPITEKWQEHLAGVGNWKNYLWNVLMFQAWLEENH